MRNLVQAPINAARVHTPEPLRLQLSVLTAQNRVLQARLGEEADHE